MFRTIETSIKLQSPVSHNEIGSDMGNVTLFRRMSRVIEGRVVRVPVVSAGAIRGLVRRLLFREIFEKTGLSRETVGSPAWDRLYAALANGGTIEAAEVRVSPDAIRERRAAIPPLSLLGSALYTSHMTGRLHATHAWLVCREINGEPALPMDQLVTEISTVRHHDAEEQNPDVSNVGPMPTTVEVVIAGAEFLQSATISGELEASCWAHGLDMVTHIGGKTGQGNGGVWIDHDGDGAMYREWLESNIEPLREALLKLADELTGSKKKGKR